MNVLKILQRLTGQNFVLPFYHAVCDKIPLHLKHLYNVRSVKTFGEDLDFLLKNYTPVSILDIQNHLIGAKKLPKHAFFISFDDGLAEFKDYAWPVLKSKGIPVALFVNPNFVDNKSLFFRFKAALIIDFIQNNYESKILQEANHVFGSMITSIDNLENFVRGIKYPQQSFLDDLAVCFNINYNDYLKANTPYLSMSDLVELQSQGVHIGAHSMDHPLFNQLTENEMLTQLTDSVSWVNSIIKQDVSSFSFPFTDFGIKFDFFSKIYNDSNPLVDLTFGTAGLKREKFKQHLQRIPVEDYATNMQKILEHQYLYYLAKAPLFKNTIRRG